ncbi:MAG: hypothetical protein OXH10_01270 [bacterium]|nr:hypothetical protein [bacterium]MCY3579273.1 hypothetical protein [bacterium]MCY3652583.1 hypothetical protein [bacterium]
MLAPVGVAVAYLGTLVGLVLYQESARRKDIGAMRTEMQKGFSELRGEMAAQRTTLNEGLTQSREEMAELRGEMAAQREEVNTRLNEIRTEMNGVRGEMGALRTDLTTRESNLRGEMQNGIKQLRGELAAYQLRPESPAGDQNQEQEEELIPSGSPADS